MTNPGWAFVMKESGADALDLDIYDDIGESFWGDTVSAKDVRAKLSASQNAKTIRMRVNSRGGDVFDGFAIYALLQAHPARVEAHVDGIAASMASIIIMAADEITVSAGAMIMIHNPWAYAVGESDDLRATADLLDKMQSKSADVYVARTGISREKIIEMMDAETWLTADEAKAQGFADIVKPAKKATQTKALASIRLDGLKPPNGLIAACAQARSAAPNVREGAEPEQELTTMEKAERIALCSALGLSADVSADVLIQKASALVAAHGKAPEGFELTPKGELASMKAAHDAAIAELATTRKAARENAVNACLDEAVKSGKIIPAAREKYAALCATDAGFETVKDLVASLPVSPLLGVQGTDKPHPSASGNGAVTLTEEDRFAAKASGLSLEQALENKKLALAAKGGAA